MWVAKVREVGKCLFATGKLPPYLPETGPVPPDHSPSVSLFSTDVLDGIIKSQRGLFKVENP